MNKRSADRLEFARDQRRQTNEFAQIVWQMLRNRRMLGEKFRREHPIGPYTLDFVCVELKLNIEIDGKAHLIEEGQQRDKRRDEFLRSLGFSVLRIAGFRVTQDATCVQAEIEATVRKMRDSSPSPPTPLPEAGRGE